MAIRRLPGRLNSAEHAGQPPVASRDAGASTVTVLRDPLFAVMVAGGAQPETLALALIEGGGPVGVDGAPVGCAARLNARTVVVGATAGAVFQTRGQEVECLLGGCAGYETRAVSTRAGDLYALCSPGLLAAVAVPRIRAVLRSQGPPALIARRLLAFAHQSQDARDAAVVVFRVRAGA